MSASSDYLRVLTDITREGGATRAATARANSAIWGNTVSKLGDFASDAIKQYGIDKKAKKDEQWQQNLSDLFKRTSEEFKAQQEPSMAELTAGTPTTTETYTPGGLQGSFAGTVPQSHVTTETTDAPQTFTGPDLKGARPPRLSPFPSPSEIMSLGNPIGGMKVIDGLAALQKLNPQDDPETRLKRMQASYVALDQFSDKEKAAALPGLMGAFETAYGLDLGPKDFTPERWAAMGKALQIPTNKNEAKIAQITVPGADGPMTKFVEEKAGAEYPQYVKPDKEATITPYQQAELAQQEKNFGLAQQRLALAIKQANKPAIAKEASGLADAVMNHPELFAQLTPSEKGSIVGELDKRGFKDFKKPLSATMENRLASAKAVVQTGDDITSTLKDPKVAAMLGPAMGRYNNLREFLGDPPPELSELAGNIGSFALAQMGVHGMRNAEMAKQIEAMLDAKHTPESLAARINGINKFANHLLENEGRTVGAKEGDTKPIPGYPGTEQTYRGGHWIRTK